MSLQTLSVVSKEPGGGTFFTAMGLMEMLKRHCGRVAYFKPIVSGDRDEDVTAMLEIFNLSQTYKEAAGVKVEAVEKIVAEDRLKDLYEASIARLEALKRRYDFVLCQGIGDPSLREWLDFDLNVAVAKNLAAPVVGVVDAHTKDQERVNEEVAMWRLSLKDEGIEPFAFIINRADEKTACALDARKPFADTPCFVIPYDATLDRPTVMDLLAVAGGELLHLKDRRTLERTIGKPLIAAMHPERFLDYFKKGDLVVVPGDRSDIFTTLLAANRLPAFPVASAVIVGGKSPIDPNIMAMIEADEDFQTALIAMPFDTMEIVRRAGSTHARITAAHRRKIDRALGLFAQHVDAELIEERIAHEKIEVMTPTMFLHRIFAKAADDVKKIVLPESDDERILRAAEAVMRRKIAHVILLGRPDHVKNRAAILGIDLEGVEILDPEASGWREDFAQTFYELRKAKGVTLSQAADTMKNITYFATMMVYKGYADGMVSGATHTTRETVRPALQIIKTKPGIDIVSSVFFMCLDTKVLVYGDCAIVPDPDPKELAQIAVESADTAKAFGIEPRVAMLSYSTGNSGVGEDVQKVRQATKLAQQMRPDIPIEGPMQYDAAVDEEVAKRKMPGSKVAGRATVFIFPDLNTGNNTYKAVQRSTGAIAVGPVLQGLRKPVNDLSRGCLVEDVISTVAITAVQAQQVGD